MKFGLTLVGVSVFFLLLTVVGLALPIKNRINSNPSGNIFANSLLPPAFAGFDSNVMRVFDGYASWPTSVAAKAGDTLPQTLKVLSRQWGVYQGISTQVDINSDGLTDVLVHSASGASYPFNFGVFLNKGNLQYDLTYKCVYTVVSNVPHYYGDCADTASSTNTLLPDIFNNYAPWPTSTALKATDLVPEALADLSQVYNSTNFSTIADINGDGLADILFHNAGYPASSWREYGIFLNKGNLQYDLAYKCVSTIVSNVAHYYGDCADTASTAQTPWYSSLNNYASWPHSANINANDTMLQTMSYMSHATWASSGDRYSTLTDMNGDGLPDVVYHRFETYNPYNYLIAVFFNKGNLQFELGYKCVANDLDWTGPGQIFNYYGDCAG